MTLLVSGVLFALWLFYLFLLARVVISWIAALSPGWRPQGSIAVVVDVVYTVTDPPIRFLRKFIPDLQLGPIRLPMAILVLFVMVTAATWLLAPYAAR